MSGGIIAPGPAANCSKDKSTKGGPQNCGYNPLDGFILSVPYAIDHTSCSRMECLLSPTLPLQKESCILCELAAKCTIKKWSASTLLRVRTSGYLEQGESGSGQPLSPSRVRKVIRGFAIAPRRAGKKRKQSLFQKLTPDSVVRLRRVKVCQKFRADGP